MTMSNKNDIITDNNVMIYLREGNEYAFRFIFDKYYDFLCMVADSYLRDEYISETIVGDIINYLQQEYIQREISINQYEDKAAIEELFFIENKHPLESLLEQELENKINSIINELSPECRAVFKMSRFDGMKYEEIASELNISVNPVKYHMKNALGKLRLELKDYILSILVFLTLL